MRALVTGCGGFVGRFLTDFLLSRGTEVFGLDFRLDASQPRPSSLYLTTGDIQDERLVADVMRDVRPDHVYHLAAVTVVAASLAEPRLTYGINVGGALNLCEAIHNLKLRVRMLNVSSGYVYVVPENDDIGCTEESPVCANSPYAATKLMSELLASSYVNSYGLEIMTARPFTHIGPGQSVQRACASFAHQVAMIRKGLQPPVLRTGSLNSRRDLTDVRDVVKAYWLIAMQGIPGQIYNVCSGVLHSMQQVVDILCSTTELPIQVEMVPDGVRHQEQGLLFGSPAKIRQQLGWTARIPLRQTLSDMVDYWCTEQSASVATRR